MEDMAQKDRKLRIPSILLHHIDEANQRHAPIFLFSEFNLMMKVKKNWREPSFLYPILNGQ
jgi:hypothetical protein